MEESIADWVRNLPDEKIVSLMKIMASAGMVYKKIPPKIRDKLLEVLLTSGELKKEYVPTKEDIEWFAKEICNK